MSDFEVIQELKNRVSVLEEKNREELLIWLK